jgi:hypothetical protein
MLLGLLGLEHLEGAQRTPELGHGGVAVAHQGFEAAGAVAVADQREAGVGALVAAAAAPDSRAEEGEVNRI